MLWSIVLIPVVVYYTSPLESQFLIVEILNVASKGHFCSYNGGLHEENYILRRQVRRGTHQPSVGTRC
jgi:hypothetical protein